MSIGNGVSSLSLRCPTLRIFSLGCLQLLDKMTGPNGAVSISWLTLHSIVVCSLIISFLFGIFSSPDSGWIVVTDGNYVDSLGGGFHILISRCSQHQSTLGSYLANFKYYFVILPWQLIPCCIKFLSSSFHIQQTLSFVPFWKDSVFHII